MNRMERVNSELKKQLSLILMDSVKDPRVAGCLVGVQNVSCDSDLTLAKIYVSIMGANGNEKIVIEGLNNAQGYIKSCLKSKIQLRAMPELRFIYDDSVAYSIKIGQIIEDIKHQD